MKKDSIKSVTSNDVRRAAVDGTTAQSLVTHIFDTSVKLPADLTAVFGKKDRHIIIAIRDKNSDDMAFFQRNINMEYSKAYNRETNEYVGGQTFGIFHLETKTSIDSHFITNYFSDIASNFDLVNFYLEILTNLTSEDYRSLENGKPICRKKLNTSEIVNLYDFPKVMDLNYLSIVYSKLNNEIYIADRNNKSLNNLVKTKGADFTFSDLDAWEIYVSRQNNALSSDSFKNKCLQLVKNLTKDDIDDLSSGEILHYKGDNLINKSKPLKINPNSISVNKLLCIAEYDEWDRNYMVASVEELASIIDSYIY